MLRYHLVAAGVAVDFVGSQRHGSSRDPDHEGHGGWRTDQVLPEVDGWLTAARPDVVLLNLGTNDMRSDYYHGAIGRLSTIIDKILASSPTVKIVLSDLNVSPSTLIPGFKDRRQKAGYQPLYNAAVAALAPTKGPRVALTRMSRIPWCNTVDGVHPSALGYRQMAFQWYQALRRILPDGKNWPAVRNPFPTPEITCRASARTAAPGQPFFLYARLSGRLTARDLGGIRVELQQRRKGTWVWYAAGTTTTLSTGGAAFRRTLSTSPTEYRWRVLSGLAKYRISPFCVVRSR